MSLSDDILALIKNEEAVLQSVISSLEKQRDETLVRLTRQSRRAEALTSDLLKAQRDEDIQMLSSDEVVARKLRDKKELEAADFERLLESPYFARVIFEESESGKVFQREIRLNSISNSELRIIDWRKAPLARLYYEYKEGDQFSEEIHGRERTGRILLKHKVEIERGRLVSLTCARGTFILEDGEWKEATKSRRKSRGILPDIQALLTPEQYRLVVDYPDRGMIVRGVAGSGKTSIALYRLKALIDSGKVLNPLILVRGFALRCYVRASLDAIGLPQVPVHQGELWLHEIVKKIIGNLPHVALIEPPPGVARVLRSAALVETLGEVAAAADSTPGTLADYYRILARALSFSQRILERDETRLLDNGLMREALSWVQNLSPEAYPPDAVEPLVAYVAFKTGSRERFGAYDHIVVDEVQDYSPAELSTVTGLVPNFQSLTIVGDSSQSISGPEPFPVWEHLRKLHEDLEHTEFFTLTVSHRSTLPIVRFAEFLQQRPLPTEGRPGKAPLWFFCDNEDVGIPEAIAWLERVARRFPLDLIAVLCRDEREAKLVFSFLEPTFGSAVRLGDRHNFSFEEGIIVTSIEEAKGLEFPSVMIWNPTIRAYPLSPVSRNLLYTASTRAEERLCFATWQKPSPILPPQSSHLVRLVAVEQPEVEETRSGEDLFDNPEQLSQNSGGGFSRPHKFSPPRGRPIRPVRND